ncbi:MAG: DNA polymerase III subunit gamma/tau, partial [SAR116 cluster bacterium]|nr:DNA polymerase III subunit gamma/tau [SAR116 cluster bacterium]
MSEQNPNGYRVLARKYRPDRFSELIGQEALVRTLGNALTLGRLAHAFVLTGVRGVGKTSTARLLARGLNCIGDDGNGEATLEPCGTCEPCQAIGAGRHVDVLEIDAASHTGVDDAREIIEGVGYRPVSARFKIYIIDEVHMMSKSAFNALLKTLEEPPDNVKFIFATTEIRKVPVTILSRCQRFDLRRVPADELAGHLTRICERENINAEAEAVTAIARAAEGSVRDALSLLDQAAAMTADKLSPDSIADMLGRPGRQNSITILGAALNGDTAGALAALASAMANGAEPEMVIADLLDLVHRASLKAAGGSLEALLEVEKAPVSELAELGIARLGRAWQMLLKGHGEVTSAPQP